MLTQEFIDKQKDKLERILAEIREKIANRPAHIDMDHDSDFDDEGREEEMEIETESQVVVLQKREASILRALQRIAEGNYGLVPGTNTEIPMDRLEAMPDAESIIHKTDEEDSREDKE